MDKRLLFQSIYSLASNGLPALFGLLSFRILASELGPVGLANYVLVIAVYGMFNQLRSGILTGAYIKLTSGKGLQPTLIGATWTASFFFSIALAILLVLTSLFYGKLWPIVAPVVLISILSIPSFVADQTLRSQEHFHRVALLRIVESGSMFGGLAYLALDELTYTSALWMLVVATGLSAATAFIARWTHLIYIRDTTYVALIRLWRFGRYTSGTQLITSLIINTDLFVIQATLGSAAVGIYEAGRKLMELFEVPMRSLSSLYYSRVSAMVNQRKTHELWGFISKRATRTALLLGSFSVVAFFAAPYLIELIAGPEFEQSTIVFRVLLFLPILLPFDRFYGLSLDAMGRPQRNFYKGIILFAVNLIFDLAVTLVYPEPEGVAAVSVLFYGVGAFLSIVWLKKALEEAK